MPIDLTATHIHIVFRRRRDHWVSAITCYTGSGTVHFHDVGVSADPAVAFAPALTAFESLEQAPDELIWAVAQAYVPADDLPALIEAVYAANF
ncbi:hypothetical protein [Nocardioides sp. URHA0032]|uniref:hypothetical protein n=1 Tax=Nocardioides sp. URHA0032 TaxID=1380388 RepID=UPI000490E9AF|nr:hypothetical protein [Nocardioides sp. URHA0032]